MEDASRPIAITGATALIGSSLDVVPNATIVIDGETIAHVVSTAADARPRNADVVDASGLVAIPGFLDSHVHIGLDDPAAVIRGGVTAVRDLGWPRARIWPLVEASRVVDFDGPTIRAVGPIITAPGGYPTCAAWAPAGTGLAVADAESARRVVDEVISEGAISVKIALNPPVGPVLDDATLRAIVVQAHDHGKKVTVHAHGLAQLERALDAGVDELAHMLLGSEGIPPETIRRMVDAPMAVVPTLSIRRGRDLRRGIDDLKRFVAAGGIVVYGTDLGNSGPRPGIDPSEVAAMAAAGMTSRDIVAAATTTAADWLDLEGPVGVQAGAPADVVLLGGRPLDDPSDLSDVRMVWRRGRRVL